MSLANRFYRGTYIFARSMTREISRARFWLGYGIPAVLLAWWTYGRVVDLVAFEQMLSRPVNTTLKSQTASSDHFDLAQITRAHLFGAPSEPGAAMGPVTRTSLSLLLVGTIRYGRESIALISIDGREAEPFAIGQTVTAGAVLKSVENESVILDHAGRYESLAMREPGTASPTSTSIVTAQAAPATPPASALEYILKTRTLTPRVREALEKRRQAPVPEQ
jgi:type II secretory pathway component PulC